MESEVKTVVCPNCGASAHNLHNCEFCGSFLVQRAAEGRDMREYVSKAKNYPIDGLKKVIRQYCEILQSEPLLTELWLDFDDNVVEIIPSRGRNLEGYMVGEDGIEITIDEQLATDDSSKKQLRLFKNSAAFPAFKKENETSYSFSDGTTSKSASYRAKFGYDYEGAARVVYQILEAYHLDMSEITPRIFKDQDYILFNCNGDIIEREGKGESLFRGEGEWEENYFKTEVQNRQEQNDSDDFKWKNWMTWVAVGGGILLFRLLIGY